MNYRVLVCCVLMLSAGASVQAQAPKLFNYQAIARNADGSVIANQAVGIQFSVLDGSEGGTVVYRETQTRTTNAFGLFTAQIGAGIVKSGSKDSINWGSGPK